MLILAALGAVIDVRGQERPKADLYREVDASSLVGGYVKPGERVETKGFLGVYRGKVFLKVNLASAQWPLRVDVSRLSQDAVRQITMSCAAENVPLTIVGCTARIRGEVTAPAGDRRPGIVADAIEVIGTPTCSPVVTRTGVGTRRRVNLDCSTALPSLVLASFGATNHPQATAVAHE